MPMSNPIPYLSFDGNCAEAMRFYERALGGRIEAMIRNADSPCAAQTPKGHLDRLLHVRLALDGGGLIFAGDCPAHMPYQGIKGVMLTLNYDTIAQAQLIFAALSEGGNVSMPMQATFWAKAFGAVVDRFGVSWGVNGELLPH